MLAAIFVLASTLGSEKQGTYYAALALFGVVYLLGSFGFATATVSRVAACYASNDSGGVTLWLGRLSRTWLLLGIAILPIGFLLLPWIAGFGLGGETVSALTIWLCLTPILELPRTIVRAGLEGGRRMLSVLILDGGLELLRALLVCGAVIYEPTAVSAVQGHVFATAIGLIIYGQARKREDRVLLPSIVEIARATRTTSVSGHARLGIELGLSRFSRGLLLEFAPPLLLLHFASASWVTYYRITHRLLGLPFLVTQSVSRVSLPALSQLSA
ncbi:MAG: O-antigen/teichoic acid export membrane protein [Planctomycetota bacterium]|jgi:O-antigen/teichoic acid export membrane protein